MAQHNSNNICQKNLEVPIEICLYIFDVSTSIFVSHTFSVFLTN